MSLYFLTSHFTEKYITLLVCECHFMLTGSGTTKIPLTAVEQTAVMLQEMYTYHVCMMGS